MLSQRGTHTFRRRAKKCCVAEERGGGTISFFDFCVRSEEIILHSPYVTWCFAERLRTNVSLYSKQSLQCHRTLVAWLIDKNKMRKTVIQSAVINRKCTWFKNVLDSMYFGYLCNFTFMSCLVERKMQSFTSVLCKIECGCLEGLLVALCGRWKWKRVIVFAV